jgi:polyhydroxybutyrate depolymerase
MFYLNFLASKKYALQSDGVNREYLLHFPRSYSSKDNFPLVIALHGYTDNPRLMEFYSGLSREADREGFVVVYPYGTKNEKDKNLSWNGGSCCGNGVLSDVKDVEFINNLTDELIRKYKIDPKKIFIVGFSNGGLLTHRIASVAPERYKAFAVVSGSIGGKVYKKLPEYVIPLPTKTIIIFYP